MPDLTYRQEKIQEKRKQTSFRDFLIEIASRQPVGFYKNQWLTSRYPVSERIGKLVPLTEEIDFMKFSRDISNLPFFEQLQQFRLLLPLPALCHFGIRENVAYADYVSEGSRNAYLSIGIYADCENILYSFDVRRYCKNILNSFYIIQSENVFSSLAVSDGYNVFFSKSINNSNNIRYSVGMNGCSECIECTNLDNKSYCIKNQQYTKDEYFIQKAKILRERGKFYQESYKNLTGQFLERWNTNVSGKLIVNSENVKDGVFINTLRWGKNVVLGGSMTGSEEYYDVFVGGMQDNFYGVMLWGANSHHLYCSSDIRASSHIFYSFFLDTCSFCFGCIGLKNKQFCIFNKQYTKEERHAKVDEIFTQMEKDRTLWQFFPATMNPFYFNDTAAYLIDPTFTQEEVEKAGYLRRSTPIKVDIPTDADLVKVSELDQYETFDENGNRTINPAILTKVIQDETGNARRVVKMEYDFLVKYALPLPRKHRLERMKENFKIE